MPNFRTKTTAGLLRRSSLRLRRLDQAVEVRAYPPLLRVIVADERRLINQKPQAPRPAKGVGLRRDRLGFASSGAEGKAGEFHCSIYLTAC